MNNNNNLELPKKKDESVGTPVSTDNIAVNPTPVQTSVNQTTEPAATPIAPTIVPQQNVSSQETNNNITPMPEVKPVLENAELAPQNNLFGAPTPNSNEAPAAPVNTPIESNPLEGELSNQPILGAEDIPQNTNPAVATMTDTNPTPLEEPAVDNNPTEPFKATSAPVITNAQINANNLETSKDPVELNKKIEVEESHVAEPKEKKPGNMFVGFLIVFLIVGVLGFGVYYAANKGLINIPFITTTTTTTTQVTTTTTTTQLVTNVAGNYKTFNGNCPTTPMNLSLLDTGTFSLTIIDDTCAATAYAGTYTFDSKLGNITFKNADGTSLNGTLNGGNISLNINSLNYIFAKS
jgi:hypothetical protein